MFCLRTGANRMKVTGRIKTRLVGINEGHVLVTWTILLQALFVQPRLWIDGHCGGSTDDGSGV